MNTYKRHWFPLDIISYAVWVYYRFNLSYREVECLLAERGMTVSREAIRHWCIKFGKIYTCRLKKSHRGFGDTLFFDEVFVKINGKQNYLWRAVDQECLPHERSECFGYGEVVDVYLQFRRNGAAAKRFFKHIQDVMVKSLKILSLISCEVMVWLIEN